MIGVSLVLCQEMCFRQLKYPSLPCFCPRDAPSVTLRRQGWLQATNTVQQNLPCMDKIALDGSSIQISLPSKKGGRTVPFFGDGSVILLPIARSAF